MSGIKQPIVGQFEGGHSSLNSYIFGFLSSVVLSLAAYVVAVSDAINNNAAIGIIGGLAIVQCIVQLMIFLHLGREFRPRWKLGVFALMISIVLILVIGSLWIMQNLNYRMIHAPGQMKEYIESQDGF